MVDDKNDNLHDYDDKAGEDHVDIIFEMMKDDDGDDHCC